MTEETPFEIFQKEFKKYQKEFGLLGYHIVFEFTPLGDNLANIIVGQENMSALVSFNSRLSKRNKLLQDPKSCAKHEALHLLISRLVNYGESRYITPLDMVEATEELVIKLESLVLDLVQSPEVKFIIP